MASCNLRSLSADDPVRPNTGPAFTADKTGPPLVKPGDTFNDTIDVVFVHATTGVTITDDLPAGLVPGSAAATWTATSSVSGNPKSGSCVTTASAKPEFVCNLGANVTWAKGDSVRVTVPIVAALNATGNLTNVASVVDLKNNTAGDSKTTQICTECLPPTDCFNAVKSGPTTVQAGSGFEFKISVLFSCKPAGPITITDTLPAGLQATSAPAIWRATYANGSTLASACITSGNSVTCSLNAEWGKSDKVEITVPVVASASAQGTVVNQAIVTDGNRTVAPQAPVNVTKPDPSGPPFTVSKTGPSTVKAGEAFDYNVIVTFFGASTGVVVVDDLPPQVTAQQSKAGSWKAMTVNGANPSGVCTTTQVVPSGNDTTLRTRVTCDLGKNNTWATADRVEITLPVVAGASVTGTVSNTAKVTDDKDRLAEDNHTVIINPAQPVGSPFTITKTGPTQPVLAGQAFTYSIVVGFLGQTKGVKVTDVLPATVNASATPATWISSKSSTSTPCVNNSAASPNTITCDLGTSTVWNAGDTVEISVPVVAGLSAAANTVNTATVTDDQNRTSSDTFPVTINVDPSSPFSITKAGPTKVTQGTPFLFEVNVVMLAPAKGVTIIDEMPPGLWPTGNASWTATSANGVPGGACTTTNRTGTTGDASYTCDLGAGISWARGDRIKMIVPSVATTALQTLINRASVRDDQNRRANATAGVNADLPAPPNSLMNIIKSGPTTPVAVGQPFVFTIAATFDAAGPFTAARIVDDLPAGLLPNGNATWVAQNAAAAGGRLTGTCITTPATSPEFTFTAGVAGDESVNPLIIVDELQSADLKFVAPMPPNCVQNSDQKATCTWNEAVGPGDDKLLQFRVTANKTGTFQNKATVLTTVPGVANQTATAPVTVVPTNNPAPPINGISVLKKGPSQSIEAGKEFTFTLTANDFSGKVPSMVLTDTMDAATGVTFLRVSPATGCTVAAQLLRCNLTAPWPKTLTLTAKGSKAGTFTNNVELRSADSNTADSADVTVIAPNQETCSTWVAKNGCGAGQVLNSKNAGKVLTDTSNTAIVKITCCAAAPAQSVPDVRLTKTVSKALNKQGGKFNYTFSVNNLGSLEPGNAGTAWNVIVSDSFPIGVAPTSSYWIEPSSASSVCSFTGTDRRTMRCSLGSMLSQATRKITVEVLADGKNFAGKSILQELLTNTALLSCANSGTAGSQDPKCDKSSRANTTVLKEVTPQGTVTVNKVVTPPSGSAGTVFTYSIVVDPGLSTVTNVVVTDRIPPQLTNAQLLTPFGRECAITTAARRAATPAAPAPPPARRNTRRNNNNNPLGNVIDAIRGGGGGSSPVGAPPASAAAQQTLRCTFASLSSRREIRYTAVGSIVGTWTNLVTVQAPGETPKNDSVPVIIAPPARATGSCCDASWGCRSNVGQSDCEGAGGTWSSSATACNTKTFCSGACCSGGGTLGASCRITKKAMCEGSLFSSNTWSASGDCNSGFCPKPTQWLERAAKQPAAAAAG
ncbi:hypothetical protein OEZ86_002047 [Tetradesmus obliquus]|nr:hypothetical protein OEZ86_002047 [Tetradesmus obliquus]